ncbi:MAG TPA: hypothetical protein VJI97_00120 [Candidatus Nanoarchaeia archaeon]|nr:hypothetical protein [Candidatus Nanoarchaeia archaeon]
MKKIINSKTAKGITGFTMAMLMMISVFMFALSNNSSITANVVKYESIDTAKSNSVIQIKEINSLSQLNEGWYEIRNGFVFYLEDFNTPIPLYIRLKNSQQNGLAVVDADGTVSFEETSNKLVEKIITDKDIRKNSDDGSNLITGNVAGLSAVTGMQATQPRPNANPSPPPGAPAAPQAPATPPPPPSTAAEIISGSVTITGVVQAVSGEYYYQRCPTCKLQTTPNANSPWTDVPRTFIFNAVGSNNQRGTISIDKKADGTPIYTESEAKDELASQGYRNLQRPSPTSATQLPQSSAPTGTYVLSGDGRSISNGQGSAFFIPADRVSAAIEYLQEMNNYAAINGVWNTYLKSHNLQPSEQNKIDFIKYRNPQLSNLPESVMRAALGMTQSQSTTGTSSLPYTMTPLSDSAGTVRYDYNGKSYYSSANQVPPELQGIIDFKKNHPTAVVQQGITTSSGQPIYLENSKYIDGTGTQITQAVREETISGNKYQVTYSVDGRNLVPQSIRIGDSNIPINAATFNYLRANVGKDDILQNTANGLVITKTVSTRGRQTTSRTITLGNDGSIQDQTTFETKNSNGGINSRKLITQNYPSNGAPTIIVAENERNSDGTINNNIVEIETDMATGKPIRVTVYDSSGPHTASELTTGNGRAQEIFDREKSQYNWRTRFARWENALTEFRGLGYYPSLFWDKAFPHLTLLEWRNKVDDVFSSAYLGIEPATSNICSHYINTGASEGVVFADTPQGVAQVAAHVEATRTQAIETETGKEYVYKITFSVRNGDYATDPRAPEKMHINVIVKGDREAKLYRNNVEVKRGDTFGKAGTKAIVKQTKYKYDKICIDFDQIPAKWHIENKQLCNNVVEEQGTPLSLERIRQQEEQQASGEPVLNDDW